MPNAKVQGFYANTASFEYPATSGTIGVYYSPATVSGNLLVALVVTTSDSNFNTTLGPTVINTPVTTDGSEWELAAGASTGTISFPNADNPSGFNYRASSLAVFYIPNAPAKAAIPYEDEVTFTNSTLQSEGGGNVDDCTAVVYSYEFSGNPLDYYTSETEVGTTAVPQTTNLVIPSTYLIYAATSYVPTTGAPGHGTGYTQGVATPSDGGVAARDQYILNQTAGSIATAFAFSGGAGTYGWACAAIAFGPGGGGVTIIPQPRVWISS